MHHQALSDIVTKHTKIEQQKYRGSSTFGLKQILSSTLARTLKRKHINLLLPLHTESLVVLEAPETKMEHYTCNTAIQSSNTIHDLQHRFLLFVIGGWKVAMSNCCFSSTKWYQQKMLRCSGKKEASLLDKPKGLGYLWLIE